MLDRNDLVGWTRENLIRLGTVAKRLGKNKVTVFRWVGQERDWLRTVTIDGVYHTHWGEVERFTGRRGTF